MNSGVLILNHATAIPGGIGATGGASALIFTGGVLGLGVGDFTRNLGTASTVSAVNFYTAGGWAAYNADRMVNLNNDGHEIVWATADTGFNRQTVILSASTATHKVTLQNGLNLGNANRTVQTENGTASIDAELSGVITGITGGGLTKSNAGTLALTNTNTYIGATTITGGVLEVSLIANGGVSSNIGASTNAAANLALNGGTLRYTGAAVSTDRGFTLSNNSGIDASGTGAINFANTGTPAFGTADAVRTLTLTGTNTGNNTLAASLANNGTAAVSVTKTGTGNWILSGSNTHTGTTTVNAGKLFIDGDQSLATGNVTVSANATLGGTGTIGGNTTIANNGKLEFNLGTTAASHDPLDFVAGKGLTFSGASVLTITVTSGAVPGLYTLVTGGNNITFSSLPTVILPPGWAADAPTISGNKIQIKITSTNAAYTLWATTGSFTNTFNDITSTGNSDSDNLTNLQEFAFGTDPTLSNFAPLSYLSNGTANPGFPILENTGTPQSPIFHAIFSRRKNHATAGITYDVQFSANLQYWKTSLAGMTVLSGTSTTDVEAVSVPFPASVPTSAAETEFAVPKFFRIGVSEN